MGTLTTVVDDEFIKMIDRVVKESKMYSSRSEFLKDAVREKYEELMLSNPKIREIRMATRELARKARENGWDGSPMTREDRERIARKHLREKGLEY